MLGHGAFDGFFEGKWRLIAEHAPCLFDRIIKVEADEFKTGFVDERRILGAAELGDALDRVGENSPAGSGMCRVGGLKPARSATRDRIVSW